MSNIVELRPRALVRPAPPAMDLADPEIADAVFAECQRYALGLYKSCVRRDDVAAAATLAETMAQILRAMHAAQTAAQASAVTRQLYPFEEP